MTSPTGKRDRAPKMHLCVYCKNSFVSNANLLRHQEQAIKCLNSRKRKIGDVECGELITGLMSSINMTCTACHLEFNLQVYDSHITSCVSFLKKELNQFKEQAQSATQALLILNKEVLDLRERRDELQERLSDIEEELSQYRSNYELKCTHQESIFDSEDYTHYPLGDISSPDRSDYSTEMSIDEDYPNDSNIKNPLQINVKSHDIDQYLA